MVAQLDALFTLDGLIRKNNGLGATIITQTIDPQQIQLSVQNNVDSGYRIVLDETGGRSSNTKDELFTGTSADRGANTIAGRSLAHDQRTQILAAGRDIEQAFADIGAYAGLKTNWVIEPNSATPEHWGQLNVTNETNDASGAGRRSFKILAGTGSHDQAAKDGDRALVDADVTLMPGKGTASTDVGDTKPTAIWQARDAFRLGVTWEGNRSNGADMHGNATIGRDGSAGDRAFDTTNGNDRWLFEGDDSAYSVGLLNARTGGIDTDFFKNFHVADNDRKTELAKGASWTLFTQAQVANATNAAVQVGDRALGTNGAGTTHTDGNVVYSFEPGALNNKTIKFGQLLQDHAATNATHALHHNITFGADAEVNNATFTYGERPHAGSYTDWRMGNNGGVRAWESHTYYGENATYFFQNGAAPDEVIRAATVWKQNTISASLLFEYNNGVLSVRGKGYDDDGSTPAGLDDDNTAAYTPHVLDAAEMTAVKNGGEVTLLGIRFTDLHIDVAGMMPGDKFVINVAGAARLTGENLAGGGTDNDYKSTANIQVTGDPFQQGNARTGSSMQYRLTDGTEGKFTAGNSMNLLGYYVSPINGSSDTPGVGYYNGSLQLEVDPNGFNHGAGGDDYDGSTVGSMAAAAIEADDKANRIHAEVNYQGDTKFNAGALVTSAYFQRQEADKSLVIASFVSGIGYSNYEYGTREDGTFGQLNERGAGAPADGGPGGKEVYNKMNGSLIFDVLKVENNLVTFRVQGRMIDRDGNEYYAEQEELALYGGANTEKNTSVAPPITPANVAHPVRLFADSPFGGIFFDEFTIGDHSLWTEGDRFTVSLAASGFYDGMSVDHQMDLLNKPGAGSQIDEIDIFSDNRGSTMPHSFRFNDGVVDNKKTDLKIYQLVNNLVKDESDHFRPNQVMDGTLSLTFGEYNPGYDPTTGHNNTVRTAATFEVKFERGHDFGVAHWYSNVEDIAQFWNANGRYILESNDQKLTIRQGGRETDVQIGGSVELGELSRQISDAIWSAILKQHQQGILRGENDKLDPEAERPYMLDKKDKNKLFQFVNNVPGDSANESVVGTFLAHSVVSGASMGLEFYGSEELMRAFNFATIQEGRDTQFDATVSDAHSGKTITSLTRITAGTTTNELLFDGVSLNIDNDLGILRAKFNDKLGTFKLDVRDRFDHVVHLTDNALRLQVGANEGEDMLLSLGDMSAEALGVADISLRSRESASAAITQIDRAIGLVSSQRAMIGGQINRLEHTISSLSTASTNTTEARSRIVDADMANEMMEKTKLDIVMQAGSAMLQQANQLGNNVMALLR